MGPHWPTTPKEAIAPTRPMQTQDRLISSTEMGIELEISSSLGAIGSC